MATRSAATARCGPTGRPACAFPLVSGGGGPRQEHARLAYPAWNDAARPSRACGAHAPPGGSNTGAQPPRDVRRPT
eukprot:354239-Chlamydomonas_euryale.AAC.8